MNTILDPVLWAKIEDALKQIRPFLEADGGDVSLVEISEEYVAKVKLHGSCSSCSMSHMTMKAGIEDAIKKSASEIKSVVAV
ncbi:MAG: NifU family protein [Bacteroidota bacterium]|jgi:Fe-S cluster biogenesis protein NfuA